MDAVMFEPQALATFLAKCAAPEHTIASCINLKRYVAAYSSIQVAVVLLKLLSYPQN